MPRPLAVLAVVLACLLAACEAAYEGAWPMPDTAIADFRTLVPANRPNRWLVAPPGYCPPGAANAESPVYPQPPERLGELFGQAIAAEPRLQRLDDGSDPRRFELVQRSRVFRFPDRISVEMVPVDGGAAPAIYSRALVGYSDFGVNRKRIEAWLAALDRLARAGL